MISGSLCHEKLVHCNAFKLADISLCNRLFNIALFCGHYLSMLTEVLSLCVEVIIELCVYLPVLMYFPASLDMQCFFPLLFS